MSMPPRFDPTRNVEDLEVAISQANTANEAWDVLHAWRKGIDLAAPVAARSLRVWDSGLARLVGLEHRRIEEAMKNPTWTQSESDMASKGALQVLRSGTNHDSLRRASFVLRRMAGAGVVTDASLVTQELLAMLDGKPKLTMRQHETILVLLEISDLSENAYEHIFTCVRRAGQFGAHPFADLPAHPRATAAHWTLWFASDTDDDHYTSGMVLERASRWAANRRDPDKRALLMSHLDRWPTSPANGSYVFGRFVIDPEVSLTPEELETLYVQCGAEEIFREIQDMPSEPLQNLTPEAYSFLVRKEPEHTAAFRVASPVASSVVAPRGAYSRQP